MRMGGWLAFPGLLSHGAQGGISAKSKKAAITRGLVFTEN
jgi:hypothetical protein